MFIDSHCHLHFVNFTALGIDEAMLIQEALENQVEHILCVATHPEQYTRLQILASKYPNVSISIGLHPTEDTIIEPTKRDYLKFLRDPKVVAIGETGLDYYQLQGDPKLQQERFRTQIQVAIASNKPLIIHTRDAKDDTLRILQEEQASKVGGVFHCFTGDIEFAKQVLNINFCISLSGIVTFNKAHDLKAVAKWLPLDRLLIETDSPYLAPVPFRGKINKPMYVRYIAEYVANLRDIDIVEFSLQLKQNYYRIFGVGEDRTPLFALRTRRSPI